MTDPFVNHSSDAHHSDALCDADAEALEALLAAECDPSRVDPSVRDRAEHVAKVLGLLDSHAASRDNQPPADADLLIGVTLARVSRERRGITHTPDLCDADHDALELLVGSGYAPERVPGGVRTRARKQIELLTLLGDLDPQQVSHQRDGLVSATLQRVQASIDATDRRMRRAVRESRMPRRGLADLVSVAAMLLIAGSVLWPMVSAMREYGRRSACQSNLLSAGLGFGAYANDFRDSLPMASESRAGNPWWNVGRADQSNSANLFTLSRTGYANLKDFACSGNASACSSRQQAGDMDWRSIDQVSYSFQNMFAPERTRWVQPSTVVVVADRSPIIPLALAGEMFNPTANSLNHAGLNRAGMSRGGQNVLFNDRSVRFLRSPVLENQDNIYLPRALEEAIAKQQEPTRAKPLNGRESPSSANDGFVGP